MGLMAEKGFYICYWRNDNHVKSKFFTRCGWLCVDSASRYNSNQQHHCEEPCSVRRTRCSTRPSTRRQRYDVALTVVNSQTCRYSTDMIGGYPSSYITYCTTLTLTFYLSRQNWHTVLILMPRVTFAPVFVLLRFLY